jgi:phage portal protein BeeE
MDASLSTASLTYSTQEGQRNEFADFTLPYWLEPIQQRLSLDDVVPSGQRVRFDLTDLYTTTPSPTGTITED